MNGATTGLGASMRTPWLGSTLVFLATLIACLGTLQGYGMVIDEATYVWVAEEERLWFQAIPEVGVAESFTPEALRRRWHFLEPPSARRPDEHSNFNLPLAMHWMNVGWLLFHTVAEDLIAYRLAVMLLFAATCTALVRVIAKERGGFAGLLAWGFLAASPRVFGHAHLAATETPLCCFWLLALLAAAPLARADGMVGWRRAFAIGVLCGATASVKLTGWFLPVFLLAWLVTARPIGWWRAAIATVLMTPVVIVVLTPVLWHAPLHGLVDYVRAAASNPWKIPTMFPGQAYAEGLPWYSGLVIWGATIPMTTLILAAVGTVLGFRDRLATLFAWNLCGLLLARCLGLVPGHDGDRQILPAYYCTSVLASLAAERLTRRWRSGAMSSRRGWNAASSTMMAGVLLAEPVSETWRYRDIGLCYYHRGVGGLSGAAALGFEISYWFEAVPDADWRRIVDRLPQGSRVFVHPDHPGLAYLTRRGLWRSDLVGCGPSDADFFLLYAKRSAYWVPSPTGALVETDLFQMQQSAPADFEIRVQGVRLLGLFRRR